MNDYTLRLCRICLKSERETYLLDSRHCNDFFIHIIGAKDLPQQVWLCIWCRVLVKKTINLIQTAQQSQRVLENCMQLKQSNVIVSKKELYAPSYYHNSHIDIKPIFEEIISENPSEDNVIETTESMKKEVDIIIYEKEKIIKKSKVKKKKKINHEEMNFDVKFLSTKEQLEEIEMRKRLPKYQEMRYHCELCGVGFLTNDVYLEHTRRHEETAGPYECKICYIRFKSKEVLSQHSLSHARRFICRVCGAVFKRWSLCMAHRSQCGGVGRAAACRDCGKVFDNEYSLNTHIKGVHKTERKHACEQCGKSFATKQRLAVHSRTHNPGEVFPCPECSRTFTTNSNLRAHRSVHTQEKRHYCVECDKYYKTTKGLRRHLLESAKHKVMQDLTYSCSKCEKRFPTENTLMTHIHARHMTSYRCCVCSKVFSNKANLLKHTRRVHPDKELCAGKPAT